MEDNLTEKSIEQKQSVPWEQRKEKGLLKALWETMKEVLFHPKKFFDKLVGVESFSAAFWFYVAINITSFFVGTVVLILANQLTLKSILSLLKSFPFIILLVPIVFIIICIAIYISAAIMHLFVWIFRGEGGYKGTFNILAYSSASELWFLLLATVGMLISFVLTVFLRIRISIFIIPIAFLTGLLWMIVITIIGYMRIHGFGIIRAICAFLVPVIIFAFISNAREAKERNAAKNNPQEAAESLEDALKNLERARKVARERVAKAQSVEISAACKGYFANMGKYPLSLEDLSLRKPEYINIKFSAKATNPESSFQGYYYIYESSDGSHFTLYAKPASPEKGDRTFFIDESGVLRLEGPDGEPIEKESKN